MLTLGIIEYLFYRHANSGMDLYFPVVCLIDPSVWEMENSCSQWMLRLIPDSMLPLSGIITILSFILEQSFNFLADHIFR